MGRSSRFNAGDVLRVLGAVVALGGYVLLIGGAVAWLDVRRLGVPPLSVVAQMPRNELFGLGFEALLVWAALGLTATVVLAWATTASSEETGELLVVFVAGLLFAAGFFAIGLIEAQWLRDASWALWIVGFLALLWFTAEGKASRLRTLVTDFWEPLVVGAVVGALLGVFLIGPGRWQGLLSAAGGTAAACWVAAALRERRTLRAEETELRRRTLEIRRELRRGDGRPASLREAELRDAAELAAERRRDIAMRNRRATLRVSGALLALAAALGAGAVLSRGSHDFWRARVTMTNGTCLAGTLLVDDGEGVLLAGREHESHPVRMVKVPAGLVSSVQVLGPPTRPLGLQVRSCRQAATNGPPREVQLPYPLGGVGGSEAAAERGGTAVSVKDGTLIVRGTPGPRGKQGPEGRRGVPGPRGPGGSAGAKGDPGPRGATGAHGVSGKTGPRGAAGAEGSRGERGATGARGATGTRGPKGEHGPTGPRGPTGERGPAGTRGPIGGRGPAGPRGSTGERGPPGPAAIDGS